jgi:hypothetical protein
VVAAAGRLRCCSSTHISGISQSMYARPVVKNCGSKSCLVIVILTIAHSARVSALVATSDRPGSLPGNWPSPFFQPYPGAATDLSTRRKASAVGPGGSER